MNTEHTTDSRTIVNLRKDLNSNLLESQFYNVVMKEKEKSASANTTPNANWPRKRQHCAGLRQKIHATRVTDRGSVTSL